MKLYLDTGDVEEIRHAVSIGIIDGCTTNPTLIAKSGRKFEVVVKDIAKAISQVTDDFTVSAEVLSLTAPEMVKEAIPLTKIDKHVIIKVPCTPEGLTACRELTAKKIKVNVTLCFSPSQALLAAKAGAWCVSPFIGRLDDISQDGIQLVKDIRQIYDNYKFPTKILAASIRHPMHVVECAKAGADICTVPYVIYDKLFRHPLTDSGLKKFMEDWTRSKSNQ
ncbi:MAG: fructose-6-phosphate aldolase [Candidatus Woesearchaeota archaeon]